VGWGYELIKHDFTSYELLGQWGFAMGASPTIDGWSFHDRSLTNAEILSGLYRDIRGAAGEDRIVLGCNTVGHLAVGHFDAQRTGDDVSGREWERTRRMGVNTLAFRLPQNGVFFAGDADCVPLTHAIPWALTKRWLEAVAGSGTVLLISPEPGAVGAEQKVALREAFRRCASGGGHAEPVDWVSSRTPGRWSDGARYEWLEAWGAGPFGI
jgi:alpha-galactosidase